MKDIFDRITEERGPLGQYIEKSDGYFTFPKLEGELGPRMKYQGREVLNWSLNNYLGLGNHPEVRKVDADAAKQYGLAYPMGARMMSGHTSIHEELEEKLAKHVNKPSAYLLNFGYQGMVSIIDCIAGRNDVIVYDSECHACIMDGIFLHKAKGGKSYVFPHNDMGRAKKMLDFATNKTKDVNGGILFITEGVFGMAGDLGNLAEIVKLKEHYSFRLLVDDAHGFGTMGKTGAGTGEHYNCQDGIDLYFSTFAKAMAGIGAFIASTPEVIDSLRYNMRSQIFAKSLPMPMVKGAIKRLEMLQTHPELKNKLWEITNALQSGFRESGLNIGVTESCVTPVYFKGSLTEGTNCVIDLRENYNIFCSIIIYPVIPKGDIILRIISTADHTLEDVAYTLKAFKEVKQKLDSGEYEKGEMKTMRITK